MTKKNQEFEMAEKTNASKSKSKALKKGPIKRRSCTDIICLVLFFIFIGGFAIISYFAYTNGDPKLLLYPTDSDGNRCGLKSNNDSAIGFEKKPFLIFFDLSECVTSRLKNPLETITSITDLSCPTPQVCVESCPKQTVYHKFAKESDREKWPCTNDVTAEEKRNKTQFLKLVKDKKCAAYIVTSDDLFKRCFPGNSSKILEFAKKAIKDEIRGSDTAINNTDNNKFEKVVNDFLTNVLDVQGTMDKLMADFTTSWVFLIVLLCIACMICFLWIVIMRWLAAPMVWFSICAFIGIFGFGTYYSVDKYLTDKDLTDGKIKLNFESVKSNKKTWLWLSIICAVLLFVILLTLIFLRSRIKIAIELIKEASKAVGSIMSTLFFPILPFLLQLCLFAGWTTTMLYLCSSSGQIFVVSNSTNATMEMAAKYPNWTTAEVANGHTCLPRKFNAIFRETGAVCHYSHQGPNPDDPLYSRVSSVFSDLTWAYVYVFFGLIWFMFFIDALGEMTLAGAFASWYWAFDKSKDVPSLPLLSSFWRCIRYHIGTLAFGSLIIAIVRMIRIILEYVDRKLKNNAENEVVKFMMKCLKCFFWCLEKFLKFINRNAYIMCAVHGRHFCASAKKAFMLILENCVRAVVLDKVVDFLLFIGKIVVVGGMGVLSFYYYNGNFNQLFPSELTTEVNYIYVPVIIIVLATYMVSSGFFSVYAMAVDTLFLCFLEDLETNDGTPDKPYFMSKNLMKILGKKNKSSDDAPKSGCGGCC